MEKMSIDEAARRDAELHGRLERLVELEMTLSRMQTAAQEVVETGDARDRAATLLAELRDIVEQQSAQAEQILKTFRAERGIHPDD